MGAGLIGALPGAVSPMGTVVVAPSGYKETLGLLKSKHQPHQRDLVHLPPVV